MSDKNNIIEPIDISNAHFQVALVTDDLAKTLPSNVTMPCYCVMMNGSPLKTPQGKSIVYQDETALRQMVSEFGSMSKLDVHEISLYSLYSNQKDLIELNREEFLLDESEIYNALLRDNALITEMGPTFGDHKAIVEKFLNTNGLKFPYSIQYKGTRESEINVVNLVFFVRDSIANFSMPQLTVYVNLVSCFDSYILALMITLGMITLEEFSVAYLDCKGIGEKWGDTLQEEKQQKQQVTEYIIIVTKYLRYFSGKS
jgi:chaperone required for assembly of F1-ATPase